MTFRLEATLEDGTALWAKWDGSTYTAHPMVMSLVDAHGGDFVYLSPGGMGQFMEARKSPWHWYQAGLAYLRLLAGGEPTLTGTAPEPGKEARADMAIAAEPDDAPSQPANPLTEEQNATGLNLSGSKF